MVKIKMDKTQKDFNNNVNNLIDNINKRFVILKINRSMGYNILTSKRIPLNMKNSKYRLLNKDIYKNYINNTIELLVKDFNNIDYIFEQFGVKDDGEE